MVSSNDKKLIYRPEIDGLRSLAVLPVIFFHAGFELFEGGFVGVDIFFVISGYLITSIILEDLNNGKFSIAKFYERRARRILPALFFVMVVSSLFAWFWLTPPDLKNFGQSLVATATFSSNFLFWLESGYFDATSELKPLLHTWSLAVEEQFYIVVPFLLWAIFHRKFNKIMLFLAILFFAGLLFSEWSSSNYPDFSFYLLPARSWELLIGVIAAFYIRQHGYFGSLLLNQLLSLVGLFAIIYSIAMFDDNIIFPGSYALVPTVGTVLIVLSAVPETLVHRFLIFRPLVFLGLISYSSYLWHQPILAFSHQMIIGDPVTAVLISLCLLSVIFGYLSWRYIERPFRDVTKISVKFIAYFSACGVMMFVELGFLIHFSEGFDKPKTKDGNSISSDSGKVMLLGDSHAGHLHAGLKQIFGEKLENRFSPGCIPLFDIDRYDSRFVKGECAKNMNAALTEFLRDDRFETLVLSHMGPVYLDNSLFRNKDPARIRGSGVVDTLNPANVDRWDIFETRLIATLDLLVAYENKRVAYVIDVPELGIDRKDCSWKIDRYILGSVIRVKEDFSALSGCKISRVEFEFRVARYHKLIFETFKKYPSIELIDPTDLFCDDEFCHGIVDGENLYRDVDHLNHSGSVLVAKLISEKLK